MRRRTLFRVLTLLIAVGGVCAVVTLSDMILFWWDMSHDNDTINRVRDRAAKGPGIYERVHGGLRLRRQNREFHLDAVSQRRILIETNALGYRSPHIAPKEAGEYRILVLGDSITLAAYCDYEETYPFQLQRRLSKTHDNIRVINAAISGNSLNASLNVLMETGLLVQPDRVLMGLYLNDADASPIYPPSRGFLANSALARRISRISIYSQYEKEARRWYETLSGNPFPDTDYPKDAWRTDRVAFEAEIAKACWDWGRAWYPWAWEQMRIDLEVMAGLSRRYGFELVVVLFPCTAQVEAEFLEDAPQRFFADLMDELDLPHLDLLPPMRTEFRARGVSLAYDHCHLNPAGNAFVAQVLADFLAAGSAGP